MKRLGRNLVSAMLFRVAISLATVGGGACLSSSQTPNLAPSGRVPAPPAQAVSRVPPPSSAPVVGVDAAPPGSELPRTISLDGFAEGDRIADLTALAIGDRMLLGWVTYFEEGSTAVRRKSAGRAAPKRFATTSEGSKLGASVVVRPLDKDGEALGPAKIISNKGVSSGGVGLARSEGRADVGLAWVGKDGEFGQVFVTRLSEVGDKLGQRMITHSKTGCSDVGLTAVSDGFVVAWVESKDDSAEIFAAKVSRDLARVGAEKRVVETKGETSDIRMANRGDEVLVLWSEARGGGEGGIGAARLSASDLTVRGDPMLVLSGIRHARGIDVSKFGEGVEVAWIEDGAPGPSDARAPTRALVLARFDPAARNPSRRAAAPLEAAPSSVALHCDRGCRVVVPVAEHGELAIYGFSYDGSETPSVARRLAALTGVSTEDTSPVLVGDWLFFAEDNLRGAGRIRKAKVAW